MKGMLTAWIKPGLFDLQFKALPTELFQLISSFWVHRAYDNGPVTRHFPAKLSICLAKSNLAKQVFYTLLMEMLWSLQKKMNADNFSPYHKHWIHVLWYTHLHNGINYCIHIDVGAALAFQVMAWPLFGRQKRKPTANSVWRCRE